MTKKTGATTRAKRTSSPKTARKAPTRRVASTDSSSKRRSTLLPVLILVFLIVFGGSAAIGMTDRGGIDVKSVIEERADALAAGGKLKESEIVRTINVPKQTDSGVPNDGLVGRGNKETEQQKREKAAQAAASLAVATSTSTSTATSTDETAGNLEDVSEPDKEESATEPELSETEEIDVATSSE